MPGMHDGGSDETAHDLSKRLSAPSAGKRLATPRG